MPLLAINLSDKLFLAIKQQIEKGSYQNFESFLEISAFNQLALERGATPAELVARGHRSVPSNDVERSYARSAPVAKAKAAPANGRKDGPIKTKVAQSAALAVAEPSEVNLADADIDAAF